MVKMENYSGQHEALVSNATEVAEACLDMEGGAFFLAWVGELIQKLLVKGYRQSALLTAQKLCKAVGVDSAWPGYDILELMEKQTWLNLFAVVLMNHVAVVAE